MLDLITKADLFSWNDANIPVPRRGSLRDFQDAFIFSLIADVSGLRVLEMGGGDSRVLRRLAPTNECWNIDIPEQKGGARTPAVPGVKYVDGRMGEFLDELPAGYFDWVVSIAVLENIPSPTLRHVYDDAARVLKPGGRMAHAIGMYLFDESQSSNPLNETNNGRVAAYKGLTQSGFVFVKSPAIEQNLVFRTHYVTNPHLAMIEWNKYAPALKPLRAIAEAVSLKLLAEKPVNGGRAEQTKKNKAKAKAKSPARAEARPATAPPPVEAKPPKAPVLAAASPPPGHAVSAVESTWRLLYGLRDIETIDPAWLEFVSFAVPHAGKSKAQLFQDIWALHETQLKREGYFVEFGACDGVFLSNTWLLENEFGWAGIVAEPNPVFHDALAKNRRCTIDRRCVWKTSGETLDFHAVAEPEYSSLADATRTDSHELKGRRNDHKVVKVETVSLLDLLDQAGAPATIDYLSLDTEGSELQILKAFDFRRYSFHTISVEHNDTEQRGEIAALLASAGYGLRYPNCTRWDDWYVKL